ncbi:Lon protease family protein [Brassicibacter mesophilus]|uniref:Lon protease family protein n=1 Tax=Brassicibacter mesophilus TaxID=745119 RepID=UPI003D1A5D7E
MKTNYIVSPNELKKECDLSMLSFNTTDEISPCKEIIGQERGMKALKFGLSIKKKGYNVFVSGLTGTGRNSYAYSLAKELSDKKDTPDDWCYVFNFKKTENPIAIRLKSGTGKVFKKNIENIISKLKIEIPKTFNSKEYEDKKNVIYHYFQKKIEEVIDELNTMASEYNFIFKQTDKGLVSIPIIDDRPMKESEIEELSEEEVIKLKQNSSELSSKTFDIVKKIRHIEEQLRNRMEQLNEEVAFELVDFYLSPIVEKFKDNNDIKMYLDELENDIIKNIDDFIGEEDSDNISALLNKGRKSEDFFKRYEINLFIDNSAKKGAPVIRETNPIYYNLLGKIEHVNEMGTLKTDHTRIRPGALHEANGGYLILQAKDILSSYYSWEGLKRALIAEEATIENISKESIIAETIKPQPIPIDIKIIVIGDYYTYQLLYVYDDDFKKLFRIMADFDIEMTRSIDNVEKLISFIANQCKKEKLKSFCKDAVAKIIEYSSRLAEDQNKLTTRFNEIVEIMYEADSWAEQDNSNIVTKRHVKKAIYEKNYRNNKYEEKLQELINNGTIIIDTVGWKIGEINGLAVVDSGQYSFGRPNKITVSTFAGKDGIINIEREVNRSGSSHDKGVLILGGYLGEKYANQNPMSLSASITFEQSYSIIDGDSASSTELYALLSSLSELSINQAIATTGSVNQKGKIQPIGGVNEKIEGYFKVCKMKGFNGDEAVIIPYQNIENLMLCDEVIDAVKEGIFKIYAIKTIEEGIEILTGVPFGNKDERRKYEVGTVSYLVQKKLDSYARINKQHD